MNRHYLDHASTSALRPEALAVVTESLASIAGDPGRIHAEGLTARVALETAREQVASLLGARPRSVVLTSGGTEAIASACWAQPSAAATRSWPQSSTRRCDGRPRPTARSPSSASTTRGRVDAHDLLAAVRPDTALVHVQWGNHEVGTVQPVAEVVAACRERGVLVHVDACAAAGHETIVFDDLGADLLSVSAHKMGGPVGIGALLVRRGLRVRPLLLGGDQERARRAGLEAVALAAGFGAAAATLAGGALATEVEAQRALSDRIVAGVAALEGVRVYGDPDHRLPHLVCMGIDGIEPQAVLLGLDRAGVAAHSGSACSSEALEPSPVLEAMGVDAHRSLRLSVGWSTTEADVDAALAALPGILSDLRALASG